MTFTHKFFLPYNLLHIWLCMMQFRFTLLGNIEHIHGVAVVKLMEYIVIVIVSTLNIEPLKLMFWHFVKRSQHVRPYIFYRNGVKGRGMSYYLLLTCFPMCMCHHSFYQKGSTTQLILKNSIAHSLSLSTIFESEIVALHKLLRNMLVLGGKTSERNSLYTWKTSVFCQSTVCDPHQIWLNLITSINDSVLNIIAVVFIIFIHLEAN